MAYNKYEDGVSLSLFEVLDRIRESEMITQQEWGKKAGVAQARISELKNLVRMKYRGENVSAGTIWNISKFLSLKNALTDLIGEDKLKRYLEKERDRIMKDDASVLLILNASNVKDPEKIKKIIEFIDDLEKE
jgi:transcriptional regulator with XRE-family HTH domain